MPRHATDLREEIGAHFSRLDLLGRRTCRLTRRELHLQQRGREAPAQLLELGLGLGLGLGSCTCSNAVERRQHSCLSFAVSSRARFLLSALEYWSCCKSRERGAGW